MMLHNRFQMISALAVVATLPVLCGPTGRAAFEPGQQSEPGNPLVGMLAAVRNTQPAFLVRVDVDKQTRDYREGDYLSVRVACETDAYVYVLYQQADGRVQLIFPSRRMPRNRVAAREAVQIPESRQDLASWRIGPPFGKEIIWVVASKQPSKILSQVQLLRDQFNPVTAKQIKGIEVELGEEPPEQWAVHAVELHTHARDQAQVPPGTRRYGVFFGVSEYEFNSEYEEAQKEPDKPEKPIGPLNLPTSHRNARALADVLQEVGQFSAVRIYTNEQAAREQFRQAVTQWLPSVSLPGDTVVIFYSGHGLQIPNDNDPQGADNEPDGRDEVINPYDQVTLGIVLELVKKQESLTPVLRSRLDGWLRLMRQAAQGAGSEQERLTRAESALVRHSGISDDEFAYWLQALDGRHVALIMNGCHTGGFGENEKGNADSVPAGPFDFLDTEARRLKDIGGAGNCAVLTACSASQSSLVRPERDYSVMPYFLLQYVSEAKGPVEIGQSFEFCRQQMNAYFAQRTELIPHQPQFYPASRPVLLKP